MPNGPSVGPRTRAQGIKLSTAESIVLFRRLFRGRTDVYPVCWKARRPVYQAMLRLVPMTGARAFVRSRVSMTAFVHFGV